MNKSILPSAVLAGMLVLSRAGTVEAQVGYGAQGYNPYTGTHAARESQYNPYTGGYRQGTDAYNSRTGTEGAERTYHNPYTGTTTHMQGAYNPYTGRYAVHAGRR